MLGGTRLLVVRDGVVRIIGKRGQVDFESPVASLTVRLTRTKTVELKSDETSAIVYGISELTRLPKELDELAVRELQSTEVDGKHNATVIGPGPTGFTPLIPLKDLIGAVKASRAVADALHERGARKP